MAQAQVAHAPARALAHHRALHLGRDRQAHGGGQREGTVGVAHRDAAGHHVGLLRLVGHAVERGEAGRRRHHRDLGGGRAARDAHRLGRRDADGLEPGHERAV